LFENMSSSVRSGDILSALLYLLTKSNTTVGIIQVRCCPACLLSSNFCSCVASVFLGPGILGRSSRHATVLLWPGMQGVNGVLQMLAALPAGWAADRHRRDSMLRAGAAVGLVAGGTLALALAVRPTVWALGAAMALLGCYRGIYSAAMEAIFADSIQQGRRCAFVNGNAACGQVHTCLAS
jgi:MFS family permease